MADNILLPTTRGIFDPQTDLFTRYAARIAFRQRVIGGIPKDPRLIEGWLRAKAGIANYEEVREAMLRTLSEIGADVDEQMTFDDLVKASEAVATSKQTTGFKVGLEGLYVESRQIKAMLKESTNILFGGERWGATKKGPRSFLAERVFVEPDRLWLGLREPSGIEPMIGHLMGPGGPRSTLGYHEYVEGARLNFQVLVVRDCITEEQWREIWVHAQENGFGAMRSQGFGKFYLETWDRVS